ncbi:hypothetical protein [Methylomonas albis]|uniref:Transposase n=1 Tax=Methylomonas albis TaxID=1854563 RepID=A0ABR9D3Z3_9GAMM|nr:transposase [Methylomonas albis]MBD9357842.1 transposase [Methylomonas albis]CAD6881168.1 hypothetical protein [Methylomonas albis]
MVIDAETLEILAIEVTSNREGDAQVLPELLNQISADERIEFVSGDDAYGHKEGTHRDFLTEHRGNYPRPQKRQTLERKYRRRQSTKRNAAGDAVRWAQH